MKQVFNNISANFLRSANFWRVSYEIIKNSEAKTETAADFLCVCYLIQTTELPASADVAREFFQTTFINNLNKEIKELETQHCTCEPCEEEVLDLLQELKEAIFYCGKILKIK